jgi:glutamate dehydrogenase (NAD(P)+)
VICAAVEYAGGSESAALETISEKVRFNTLAVLERAASADTPPRAAAVAIAEERVRRAMTFRRWSIF